MKKHKLIQRFVDAVSANKVHTYIDVEPNEYGTLNIHIKELDNHSKFTLVLLEYPLICPNINGDLSYKGTGGDFNVFGEVTTEGVPFEPYSKEGYLTEEGYLPRANLKGGKTVTMNIDLPK